jgi:hypothetical protein
MIFKLILIVAWGRDHSTCNLQLDKTRNPQPATEKPATRNPNLFRSITFQKCHFQQLL